MAYHSSVGCDRRGDQPTGYATPSACFHTPEITITRLLAGLILSATGWFFERPQVSTFSVHSILATLYLGAFAGVFGILCYFALQQKANAFQASLVFLIFPLIAVSLEDYIYGYAISTHSMLLIIPLVIGIFLTLVARNIPVTSRCRDNSSQK
ncbi:DMT family transporter [Salmonella enterica subsp. enterica serovar Muenchen]